MTKTFPAIVWQEGDQFVSQALGLDVASCGSSKVEALKMLQEAVELYLEDSSDNPKFPLISEVKNPEINTVPYSYA